MARSKSIGSYPRAFFRIAETVGRDLHELRIPYRNQNESRSVAGRYFAFLGALMRAVKEAPQMAQHKSELDRYYAEVLPYAQKVECSLEPLDPKVLVLRHRNDSWYSKTIDRAIDEKLGVGALRQGPADAPAQTVTPQELLSDTPAMFEMENIKKRLMAKGMEIESDGQVSKALPADYGSIKDKIEGGEKGGGGSTTL